MKKQIILLIMITMCWSGFAKNKSPKREMRAVWIATVDNIDWPSQPGLSVEEQKKELIAHLDLHKKNGMNAVIFQIRPATDAFYSSEYEPWSQWLTGEQGKGPNPMYDPLQFAIDECRKRGMELHAWMNPYRAVFNHEEAKTHENHITNTQPELFLTYGKHKYFNPGLPETRDYVCKIVGDVVRRYDIDAIHFDDYFYPYKIKDKKFPDSLSFVQHGGEFYPNRIEDWRRDNVNRVIKQINDTIKSIKPWLPFGISPFGVWRNKSMDKAGSKTQAGQTNYDDLYADILLWLKNDWIDYVAPQIYWHIGKKVANYKVIAKWWNKNSFGKPCYIGHGVYRLNPKSKTKEWRNSDQIIRQIKLNRKLRNVDGSMYFSSKSFLNNLVGINQKLSSRVYNKHTLVPECTTVKLQFSETPENLIYKSDTNIISWDKVDSAKLYVIYRFKSNKKIRTDKSENIVGITAHNYWKAAQDFDKYKYVVTSVSRTNTESDPSDVLIFRQ